jgi:hypothetical protein
MHLDRRFPRFSFIYPRNLDAHFYFIDSHDTVFAERQTRITMEKRTGNSTRATPPKKNRKDVKPRFISVDDTSSPKSAPEREFLVRSPEPKNTTYSSTADISKRSEQEVKSPPTMRPGSSITTAPILSISINREYDDGGSPTVDIDVSAFTAAFKKAQKERNEERSENYINVFWFPCCMCDHPLDFRQKKCKCSHLCCEDCHARRGLPIQDVHKFKLIDSLTTNDDANEPESLLNSEAQKTAVEHAFQNLWEALDQQETLKRYCLSSSTTSKEI